MNESRNGIWNETKSLAYTVGRFPLSWSMAAHFPGHPVHATSGIRSIRKWLCSLARAAVNSDLGSPCCKLQGYCNRVARVGGCEQHRGRGDKGAFTSSAWDARVIFCVICNLLYQSLSRIGYVQHRIRHTLFSSVSFFPCNIFFVKFIFYPST